MSYRLVVILDSRRDGIYECACGVRKKIRHTEAKNNLHGCKACWGKWRAENAVVDTLAYSSWEGAIARCYNPKAAGYADYGGKGLTVADEWRGKGGFHSFLAHIGPRPSKRHSLDRIDNTRGYIPGNVRWATVKEQSENKLHAPRYTIDGKSDTLSNWCDHYGAVRQSVALQRIQNGWDPVRAITTPSTRTANQIGAERRALSNAIDRCTNTKNKRYRSYGGRGIYVVEEWRGIGGLERFIAHIGLRPSTAHSLDRIDNDGPYAPGNVRWALRKTQADNRSTTVKLTHNGATRSLSDWSREVGVGISTIQRRLKVGWTVAEALSPTWYSRADD